MMSNICCIVSQRSGMQLYLTLLLGRSARRGCPFNRHNFASRLHAWSRIISNGIDCSVEYILAGFLWRLQQKLSPGTTFEQIPFMDLSSVSDNRFAVLVSSAHSF